MDDEFAFFVCWGLGFWVVVIAYYVNKNRARTSYSSAQRNDSSSRHISTPSQLSSSDYASRAERDWRDPNEEYERRSRQYDEERAQKAARDAAHDAWLEAKQERQERDEQLREEAYQEREWRNAQLAAEQEARWEAAQETRERLEAEREARWEADQERREQLDSEWRRKHGFDDD